MHDIGKIGIDENILNKPQKLSSDEWKEIEKHSEIGSRILSSVNEFSEIAEHVLEHHEKWNGKGYPRGLKGEEISLQARIIAVADAFDAMTRDRAYGKALSEEEAINEIRRCSGTQFDLEIAGVFVEKVLGKEWK
jgi:HD-GYP domain-containing protein (c-di-GMP phosphodiesterase class II)